MFLDTGNLGITRRFRCKRCRGSKNELFGVAASTQPPEVMKGGAFVNSRDSVVVSSETRDQKKYRERFVIYKEFNV
jgi:hypothetical protein